MYALSCAVRNYGPSESHFLRLCTVPLFQALYRKAQENSDSNSNNNSNNGSGSGEGEEAEQGKTISLLFAGLRGFDSDSAHTRALHRLLFLSNALFSSDYSDADRRAFLYKCWFPSILSILSHFTSEDTREVSYRILLSALRSDCRPVLLEKYASEIDAAMSLSESAARAKGEEGEFELSLVEEVRQELAHPTPIPPSTTSNSNSNSSNCGAVVAVGESH